ncbi:MAG TPA: ABC transporter ATP-binding protein [Candidatus Kapabacteria bacterium]|nr:ABC transporter ATP-binding protein [Candidatus Kapabacteria bacterium]
MNPYRRFLRFVKPYWGALTANIIGSTIFALLSSLSFYLVNPLLRVITDLGPRTESPASPLAPSPAADIHVSGWLDTLKESASGWLDSLIRGATPAETLAKLAFFIIGVFIIKNVIKYISDILMAYVSNGVIKDIRNALFEKLCSLSLGYFNGQKTGVLISRATNDVSVLNDALAPLFSVLVHEPLQILIILGVLIAISPQLTLIAAASSIASLFVIRILGKFIRRYSARIQDRIGDVTAALQEALANMRIIKAYSAEKTETAKFESHTAAHFRAGMKFWSISHLINPFNEIFAITALVIVLFNGGHMVYAGQVHPADLITFIVMLFALMSPVATVAGLYAQVQRGLAAATEVAKIFEESPSVVSGTKSISPFSHAIELRNVSFAYANEPTLHSIDLRIPRGETIALVGPSGSGKSTLADLILRLYDPNKGEITLDGTNIRDFETSSYRKLFGVVTQESMLFNDTVRNNITYGLRDISDERVQEAARIANAEEFILRMPDKYNTVIGDRGTRLSGGERQRVAIARAVLRNPEILIFDEATSALDSESEHIVQQAIERLLANRTAIIIAHRLSTIQMADTIVVLEKGHIVQTGRHNELVQGTGLYRRLYEIQTGYNGEQQPEETTVKE